MESSDYAERGGGYNWMQKEGGDTVVPGENRGRGGARRKKRDKGNFWNWKVAFTPVGGAGKIRVFSKDISVGHDETDGASLLGGKGCLGRREA